MWRWKSQTPSPTHPGWNTSPTDRREDWQIDGKMEDKCMKCNKCKSYHSWQYSKNRKVHEYWEMSLDSRVFPRAIYWKGTLSCEGMGSMGNPLLLHCWKYSYRHRNHIKGKIIWLFSTNFLIFWTIRLFHNCLGILRGEDPPPPPPPTPHTQQIWELKGGI